VALVVRGDLFVARTDRGGEAKRLTDTPTRDREPSWSPDGQTIFFSSNRDGGDRIYAVNVASGATRRLTNGAGFDSEPLLSPDGKWVAYTVVTPGSPSQIVVQPASGSGGKVQIMSERGNFPVWTDRGIYFQNAKKLMLVEMQTEPRLRAGAIRELFEIPYDVGTQPLREYDVTRDGNTFVFVAGYSGRDWRQVDVALHWAAALPRIAPAGGVKP